MRKAGKKLLQSVFHQAGYELSRSATHTLPVPALDVKRARKFAYQTRLMDRIHDVPGDIVECGVFRGYSLLSFLYLLSFSGQDRRVWGFDSFEGLPAPTAEDVSPRQPRKGQLAMPVDQVRNMLNRSGLDGDYVSRTVQLVPGFFEKTLPTADVQIALLHVDADLYKSTLTVLECLYPRVASGGVIAFDEYMESQTKWPGAAKAIEEFFGGPPPGLQYDARADKYFVVKP